MNAVVCIFSHILLRNIIKTCRRSKRDLRLSNRFPLREGKKAEGSSKNVETNIEKKGKLYCW